MLAERVGWTGSTTWFRENVKRIRLEYLPADPADRLAWLAGDAVQCDLWFPPCKISLNADKAAMLALPPVPLHLGWRNRIRLGRD